MHCLGGQLYCAEFLKGSDDNRMKVSLAKAGYEHGWRGEANNISKVNVSTNRCISSECIPPMDQQ